MKREKGIKLLKGLIFLIVLFIGIGITLYLFPVMKDLSSIEGQNAFKQKVDDSGFIGMLLLFGLQVAQIFFIVLPGEPIEILAGMCYGTIGGLLFITASVAIITTTIVFLVRKFGRAFVYCFCKEEQIKKFENSKLFQNPKKLEWLFIILFLIPGTPKDLLVYLGGLLPMNPWKLICISTFVRFPSVLSSTMAGENLALGDWKMSILVYAVTFTLVGMIIFCMRKFDKSKVTKDALDSLKKKEI